MKKVDIVSKIVGRDGEGTRVPSASTASASVDLSGYLKKEVWDDVWEVRETDEGTRYVLGKLPMVLRYGMTMYAEDKSLNLPGIYDGLPIDGETIYWEETDTGKVLKAKGGGTGGGSIEYPLSWSGFSSGSYDGSVAKSIYIPSKVSELTNDSSFITSSALSGYATETWVNGKGFITSSALSGYATESYVTSRGYITSSALSGYATQSWVTGQGYVSSSALGAYLPLTGGTLSGDIVIARTNAKVTVSNSIRSLTLNADNNKGLWDDNAGAWLIATDGINTFFDRGYIGVGTHSPITHVHAVGGTADKGVYMRCERSDTGTSIGFGVGSGGVNRGIWDDYLGKWILYTDRSHSYLTNDIWINQSEWANGLRLNRTVANSGASISVYSMNNHLGQFGINGYKQFEVGFSSSGTKFLIDSSGNGLFYGGITQYSDQRKKTIINHVQLSLKEVADAPLIEHYYNSDERKTTHVGSIAQYWAGLNDWFCKKDDEGYYTMEIQNAALASAISVARELLKYETKTDKQIRKIKKRISELEEEVEKLKTA